jgi:high-affinity iron transporter
LVWRPLATIATLLVLAWACAGCGTAVTRNQPVARSADTGTTTASEPDSAVSRRLATVAEDMQTWAQVPTGPAPTLTYARGTVASLLHAAPTDELRPLGPSLLYLRWLLALQPTSTAQRAALAQEAAWSATNLATEAARGDGLPGAAAAAAETVREDLFRARWQLMLGQQEAAVNEVSQAQRSFARELAPALGAGSVAASALGQAATAARDGDAQALAAARGRAVAGLTTAAYELTLRAIAQRRPILAREWAAVRDLGPSSGTSAVGDDAIRAVDGLAAGTLTASAATLAVRRDELDAFQRRTVMLVQQATLAGYLGLGPNRAETAALAVGYWQVLAPIYSQRLGARAADGADAAFATLSTAGEASSTGAASSAAATASASDGAVPPATSSPAGASPHWGLQSADSTALAALGVFTAAPATTAEQAQRISQLVEAMRFTIARLCGAPPVPPNGEPEGTVAGPPVVTRLVNDLRPSLDGADAARLAQADSALATLPGAYGISGEESSPKTYRQSTSVHSACERATTDISTVFPSAWQRHDDDADFERIDRALARAQTAAERGDWTTAAVAAREAYAIFDLTPELRLLAVDPGLATQIEALFWNGGSAGRSLFDALSNHASPASLHGREAELEGALDQAQIVLDVSHSTAAVAVNSGIVVFREGLEALLIIAALSAGFVTAGGRWRRPVIVGAIAALPATLLTWALSSAILTSFVGYGLQLQAVLDVAALAVLAVMLAWFFQKFCWTRFAAREQARHRRILDRAPRGALLLGPSLGLAAVGFTVIYREGFETVLYLQALREQAGGGAVIEGVLLGAAFTAAIAVLMLRLRRRLPYRRVVVATATLIGILAVVMTGQTVRALQAVGWLAITPIHIDLPVWAGQWLGLYPSVQTLLAQLVCAIAIPLAAVLSERLRTRRLERRIEIARERAAHKRRSSAAAGSNGARVGSNGAPVGSNGSGSARGAESVDDDTRVIGAGAPKQR